MSRLLRLSLLAVAFATPAVAKNFSAPDGKPALSAVLPDSWKPTETERGMEATSPSGDVYASVEYAKDGKADLRALMEADGKWMRENKIVPASPESKDREFTLNGMAAHEMSLPGKDKDGPTKVTFVLVELPKGGVGVVTIWGSDKERATEKKALDAILASMKPID